MEKKISITKIIQHKAFKISMIALLLLASVAALGSSVYFSFKKQSARYVRPVQPKMKTEVKKPVVIDKSNYKVVNLDDGTLGRTNPFSPEVPAVPLTGLSGEGKYLVEPPQGGIIDSDAGMVMGTTVSGIMYDSINPSAIININGMEYFVKMNDNINNYKILSITPKQVVVQYNKSIYKAGVGELLSEVKSNSNIVNLSNKFGGNSSDSISINIRKR